VRGDVRRGLEHVGHGVGGDEEAEAFGRQAELLVERQGDQQGARRDAGGAVGEQDGGDDHEGGLHGGEFDVVEPGDEDGAGDEGLDAAVGREGPTEGEEREGAKDLRE